MQTAVQIIATIDKLIDGNRKELRSRVRIKNDASAAQWQAAWDKHPDLQERETALFRQRGFAQLERDKAASAKIVRMPRMKPLRKCPTCGCRTLRPADTRKAA